MDAIAEAETVNSGEAVTNKGDGKYTFTMPSGKVTVTGLFTKIMGGYKDCPRDSTCPI